MFDLLLAKIFLHSDKLIAVPTLIVLGLAMRLTLQFFGQTWVQTKAQTATILILPIITYVITSVISGNIALSLGMVGAMSIVRFRNPVRSPLELSVYFCAITMGIAASVSFMWHIYLVVAIFASILALVFVSVASRRLFGVQFFNASFSEGNSLSSLTVNSRGQVPRLENHPLLQSKGDSRPEGIVVYHLASTNFKQLSDIEKDLQSNDNLQSIELRR